MLFDAPKKLLTQFASVVPTGPRSSYSTSKAKVGTEETLIGPSSPAKAWLSVVSISVGRAPRAEAGGESSPTVLSVAFNRPVSPSTSA